MNPITLRFRETEDEPWTLCIVAGVQQDAALSILSDSLPQTYLVEIQDTDGDWAALGIWGA